MQGPPAPASGPRSSAATRTCSPETGIRRLRAKPVFTTPNVFPPEGFAPDDVVDDTGDRTIGRPAAARPAALLRVQEEVLARPPLLRPALPVVRRVQLRQAHRVRRPARSGRAAHRRSGEDRLPGRHQAAARRGDAHRHHPLPPRRRAPLRPGARLRRLGATGSRSSGSTCATRRASRRSAGTSTRTRDRLDFIVNNACQTVRRPPDVLPAHDGRSRPTSPADARCSASTRAARLDLGRGTPSCRRPSPGRRRARSRSARCCRARRSRSSDLFPEGRLDQDLQQVDLRDRNSWRLTLAEVSSVELLETQLVNAVAPFVLNARLKPLMLRTTRARQAHRQRVGGRRSVLPAVQDHEAPAHEHGEGRAQHDDAHLARRSTTPTGST